MTQPTATDAERKPGRVFVSAFYDGPPVPHAIPYSGEKLEPSDTWVMNNPFPKEDEQ